MQMYSVDVAPLWPELKLSMYRTHRCSRGTVVPPDVTQTTLLAPPFPIFGKLKVENNQHPECGTEKGTQRKPAVCIQVSM